MARVPIARLLPYVGVIHEPIFEERKIRRGKESRAKQKKLFTLISIVNVRNDNEDDDDDDDDDL